MLVSHVNQQLSCVQQLLTYYSLLRLSSALRCFASPHHKHVQGLAVL